jgi:3-hydroxyisobutyrate dehydrogenase
MLTDQNAVLEVAVGSHGFLPAMKTGSLWIDMSTILPESSIEHAGQAEKLGLERLDAPVIGGPQPAAKGELILIVGGERSVYEKHADFLREIGKEVTYLGSHGTGHKMKLAFNLFLGILATGFSEALVLAQKIGISPEDFVNVVNSTHHRNGYTQNKGPRVARNEFAPTFTLDMMRKDLSLALEEMVINGISLPTSAAALNLFIAAANQGYGKSDYSSIVQIIRTVNGLKD